MNASTSHGERQQAQASSSTTPAPGAVLSLPGVLPFQPPTFPPTHLTGSLDLISDLGLRPAYDAFVRPYFRNPKPLVVPLDAPAGTPGGDLKGKGRAVGEAGPGGPLGAQAPPASLAQGEVPRSSAGKGGKAKETDPSVMDLKRFKDLDELVPECLVLPGAAPIPVSAPGLCCAALLSPSLRRIQATIRSSATRRHRSCSSSWMRRTT
jgi:hypothetical protein